MLFARWTSCIAVHAHQGSEEDVPLLLKLQLLYNPVRARFIVCDMTKVYFELAREKDIYRRLQESLESSQGDADSQSQVFRNGNREDQVKQALEEIQDAYV